MYTCQSQSPNSSHHHHHLPCHFPPLVSIHLFSTSVSLFLPCKQKRMNYVSLLQALIYNAMSKNLQGGFLEWICFAIKLNKYDINWCFGLCKMNRFRSLYNPEGNSTRYKITAWKNRFNYKTLNVWLLLLHNLKFLGSLFVMGFRSYRSYMQNTVEQEQVLNHESWVWRAVQLLPSGLPLLIYTPPFWTSVTIFVK